jgi:metal-sulfur cluster biosynthetic enzyme
MITLLTTDQVNSALKEVLDPELNISILDLGLIYDVVITPVEEENRQDIFIKMTLTTPGCPLGSMIIRMIRDALAIYSAINPERDVRVEVVFDPPWTMDMMSEEAKAQLGF